MQKTILQFPSLVGLAVAFNAEDYGLTLVYGDVPERCFITSVEQVGEDYRISYMTDFGIDGGKEVSVTVKPDFSISF